MSNGNISQPLVSVILATRNEEKNVERCLKSLKDQTYSLIEIFVVDNDSSDTTRTLAENYTPNIYNLKEHISLDGIKNFRGAQVNFGVQKCDGSIIFFPDADMAFDRNLIENAVNLLQKFDALFVPEVILGRGFFGKIRNFERSFYNMTPVDAIRFIRKDFFLNAGGFDEKNIDFGADDWDITKQMKNANCYFGITSSKKYHHEEWLDFRTYLQKKHTYINSFKGYIEKWGRNDPDIRKQFGIEYRFFGVFFENGKWKRLINHPVLTIGMFCLRFLVGLDFLRRKRY